jgi:hypothetical protein
VQSSSVLAATFLQSQKNAMAEVATMAWRRLKWQCITAVTVACCLGLATLGQAQFTSLSDRSRSMLEGNWQSCRETDGQYGERVYDGKWPGMSPFELHMGPHHEFARPFNIEPRGQSARHSWDVARLRLEVVMAGGSREECESWYVTLQRSATASH